MRNLVLHISFSFLYIKILTFFPCLWFLAILLLCTQVYFSLYACWFALVLESVNCLFVSCVKLLVNILSSTSFHHFFFSYFFLGLKKKYIQVSLISFSFCPKFFLVLYISFSFLYIFYLFIILYIGWAFFFPINLSSGSINSLLLCLIC